MTGRFLRAPYTPSGDRTAQIDGSLMPMVVTGPELNRDAEKKVEGKNQTEHYRHADREVA
jgi:hypothetical protein